MSRKVDHDSGIMSDSSSGSEGENDLLAEGKIDLRDHIAAWASAEAMEGAEVRPA